MDIKKRIEQLRKERGWTVYKLSMEAGVSQSTLATIQQRDTPPKIEVLQNLCEAFKITLAQFFLEDEEMEIVTEEEKKFLTAYRKLSIKKQKALLEIMEK